MINQVYSTVIFFCQPHKNSVSKVYVLISLTVKDFVFQSSFFFHVYFCHRVTVCLLLAPVPCFKTVWLFGGLTAYFVQGGGEEKHAVNPLPKNIHTHTPCLSVKSPDGGLLANMPLTETENLARFCGIHYCFIVRLTVSLHTAMESWLQ